MTQAQDNNEHELTTAELLSCATEIVTAFVSNNSVSPDALGDLCEQVFETLNAITTAETVVIEEQLKPAVSIRKSVTHDHIVCLEDGKSFKAIKRHLRSMHGMTPAEYREKWGLASDYAMVAPSYSARRSAFAKSIGLGRKAGS